MSSEFAQYKSRLKLKGTRRSSTMYLNAPAASTQTLKSPGSVVLNSLKVRPTEDCVFEVRSNGDSVCRVYVVAGNTWEYYSPGLTGELSLTLRNRSLLMVTAKIDIDWTVA